MSGLVVSDGGDVSYVVEGEFGTRLFVGRDRKEALTHARRVAEQTAAAQGRAVVYLYEVPGRPPEDRYASEVGRKIATVAL